MKLVTSQKLTKSIKDKKNSIIQKQQDPPTTPAKNVPHYQDQTIILLRPQNHHHTPHSNNKLSTPPRRDIETDRIIRTEPKNAFQKKCFQKRRTIMPIQNLLQLQNSRSKISIPFRSSGQSLDQSNRSSRSYSKFLDKRKTLADRKPLNLLAHEAVISDRSRNGSDRNRSLSHSKKIKYSIIKKDIDC